jgi:hypothetical protein
LFPQPFFPSPFFFSSFFVPPPFFVTSIFPGPFFFPGSFFFFPHFSVFFGPHLHSPFLFPRPHPVAAGFLDGGRQFIVGTTRGPFDEGLLRARLD